MPQKLHLTKSNRTMCFPTFEFFFFKLIETHDHKIGCHTLISCCGSSPGWTLTMTRCPLVKSTNCWDVQLGGPNGDGKPWGWIFWGGFWKYCACTSRTNYKSKPYKSLRHVGKLARNLGEALPFG